MCESLSTAARIAVVLGVVALLPVMAMPAILQRVGTFLDGETAEIRRTSIARKPASAAPTTSATSDSLTDQQLIWQVRAGSPKPTTSLSSKGPTPKNDSIYASSAYRSDVQASNEIDRLKVVQQRLKSLGAHYILLERISGDIESYHFHCRVTLPGIVVEDEPFDAVGASPVQAAEEVVRMVERWRGAVESRLK